MRWALFLAVLLVGGCDSRTPDGVAESAGAKLEAAAASAGIVPDVSASIEGSWSRDTDRVCIVGRGADATRMGVTVDYGEGQNCAASGKVVRSGQTLKIRFGDCRFDAQFDGDRIRFPPDVPEPCESLCTGRASLAALTVDRLSGAKSEAATLRSPGGKLLCGG